MKTPILLTFALLATSVMADPGPADEVKAAAKKLTEAANYSWTTTTTVPEETRFRPGPVEGKTSKEGFTLLTSTNGDRKTESLLKDGKSLVKTEAGWQTAEERRAARGDGGNGGGGEGRGAGGGWAGRGMRSFKTPAATAEDLVGKVKELKKDGDMLTGDLTEVALKEMLTMGGGRRRDGGEAPSPTDAKGSVKFWIKDGVLTKYETTLAGKMTFNDNEMKLDRTATTEIKAVGTSTVDVPEEAKKKIESAPAPQAR